MPLTEELIKSASETSEENGSRDLFDIKRKLAAEIERIRRESGYPVSDHLNWISAEEFISRENTGTFLDNCSSYQEVGRALHLISQSVYHRRERNHLIGQRPEGYWEFTKQLVVKEMTRRWQQEYSDSLSTLIEQGVESRRKVN
jgi:hypothetical protein